MIQPTDIEHCMKIAIGLASTPIAPRFKYKPISLANYDVSFVNNVVRSINSGDGLSDRQRELSIKLVGKYSRQFKKLGVDITLVVENPKFITPLRQVDRTRLVSIAEETIQVQFPYNKEMISSFKSLVNKTLYTLTNKWNKEQTHYQVNYNEYNLLQIYNWTKNYRFKYTDEVLDLVNACKSIIDNRSDHAIQLVINSDNCEIKNAPESLDAWWQKNMKQ